MSACFDPTWTKNALNELGVTLQTESEYKDVATRLGAIVERIRQLMNEIPDESETIIPICKTNP